MASLTEGILKLFVDVETDYYVQAYVLCGVEKLAKSTYANKQPIEQGKDYLL